MWRARQSAGAVGVAALRRRRATAAGGSRWSERNSRSGTAGRLLTGTSLTTTAHHSSPQHTSPHQPALLITGTSLTTITVLPWRMPTSTAAAQASLDVEACGITCAGQGRERGRWAEAGWGGEGGEGRQSGCRGAGTRGLPRAPQCRRRAPHAQLAARVLSPRGAASAQLANSRACTGSRAPQRTSRSGICSTGEK